MSKYKTVKTAYNYASIGLTLAATVIIFIFIGRHLDDKYNMSPVFLAAGALLGMVIGFYHLIKQLNELQRREKMEEKEENKKRIKWN